MDSSLIAKAFDSLVSTGPVAVILFLGVWWQTKGNQALIDQLNKEREERMDEGDHPLA